MARMPEIVLAASGVAIAITLGANVYFNVTAHEREAAWKQRQVAERHEVLKLQRAKQEAQDDTRDNARIRYDTSYALERCGYIGMISINRTYTREPSGCDEFRNSERAKAAFEAELARSGQRWAEDESRQAARETLEARVLDGNCTREEWEKFWRTAPPEATDWKC